MAKKIAIIITQGNEDIETIAPGDIWRRAGIEVDYISIDNTLDIQLAHGTQIKANKTIYDTKISDYDAVFFPGGMGYKNYFNQFSDQGEFIKTLKEEFINKEDKFILSICAAPDFLGKNNLIDSRNATCYPGFEESFKDTYQHIPVCNHDNLITAAGAYYAIDFAIEVVKQMCPSKSDKLEKELLVHEYDEIEEE